MGHQSSLANSTQFDVYTLLFSKLSTICNKRSQMNAYDKRYLNGVRVHDLKHTFYQRLLGGMGLEDFLEAFPHRRGVAL